jgi:hypothetical protein
MALLTPTVDFIEEFQFFDFCARQIKSADFPIAVGGDQ